MRYKNRVTGFDEPRMLFIVDAVNKHGGSIYKAASELGLTPSQVNRAVINAAMRGVCVTLEERGDDKPETGYLPTALEIHSACRAIRKQWSREELQRRSKWAVAEWELPAPGRDYSDLVEAVA